MGRRLRLFWTKTGMICDGVDTHGAYTSRPRCRLSLSPIVSVVWRHFCVFMTLKFESAWSFTAVSCLNWNVGRGSSQRVIGVIPSLLSIKLKTSIEWRNSISSVNRGLVCKKHMVLLFPVSLTLSIPQNFESGQGK